jgi:hypothetical protein
MNLPLSRLICLFLPLKKPNGNCSQHVRQEDTVHDDKLSVFVLWMIKSHVRGESLASLPFI